MGHTASANRYNAIFAGVAFSFAYNGISTVGFFNAFNGGVEVERNLILKVCVYIFQHNVVNVRA